MKKTYALLTASLFLTTLVPVASAGIDACGDDGPVRNLPRGDETCDDVDYVKDHWTTQTVLGIAGNAVGYGVRVAFCLADADPYNWAPRDYVDCTELRVD